MTLYIDPFYQSKKIICSYGYCGFNFKPVYVIVLCTCIALLVILCLYMYTYCTNNYVKFQLQVIYLMVLANDMHVPYMYNLFSYPCFFSLFVSRQPPWRIWPNSKRPDPASVQSCTRRARSTNKTA